jgi:hypothetical protein
VFCFAGAREAERVLPMKQPPPVISILSNSLSFHSLRAIELETFCEYSAQNRKPVFQFFPA